MSVIEGTGLYIIGGDRVGIRRRRHVRRFRQLRGQSAAVARVYALLALVPRSPLVVRALVLLCSLIPGVLLVVRRFLMTFFVCVFCFFSFF